MENIIVRNACANNLKNININIEFGKLTICAGVSGSGKSSFAYETLINKTNCEIDNYPDDVCFVSQRISSTKLKIDSIKKLEPKKNHLIVIDEPLAGMTSKEADEISKFIKNLASNNFVVVVEHRREIFKLADIVLVFGPSSGASGGNLILSTSGCDYLNSLDNKIVTREINKSNKKVSASYSEFNGIKNYNVEFNLNMITSVTGPASSGKSTYLDAIFKSLDKSSGASERRPNLIEVKNKSYIRRPHIIDATPVSKNKRSTVATYYGISNLMKDCNLDITIKEALEIYKDNKLITRRLEHLSDIGLDYLKLNQPSYTLSGGECQRIKLAKLLSKKLGDRSVYIFDNPVRGLGEANISKVMLMFDKLVKKNNTILIAENDPIALKYVDKIIEL